MGGAGGGAIEVTHAALRLTISRRHFHTDAFGFFDAAV
jgi:hypothetical protein